MRLKTGVGSVFREGGAIPLLTRTAAQHLRANSRGSGQFPAHAPLPTLPPGAVSGGRAVTAKGSRRAVPPVKRMDSKLWAADPDAVNTLLVAFGYPELRKAPKSLAATFQHRLTDDGDPEIVDPKPS